MENKGEADIKPTEAIEQSGQKTFSVETSPDQNVYRITGERKALIELGARVYRALGGSEMSQAECIQSLENGYELRPSGGIYGIRLTRNNVLEVDNRNMPGDTEKNQALSEAIKKETSS